MTQYKYNVGSQSVTGNLTWNANGSLATLGITDQLNAANSQTCNFSHDDLARITGMTGASCTAWTQTFGLDPFGNITKSGSISFQPTYSASTNRFLTIPGGTPTYDANGNLTYDLSHSYTWDAEGTALSIDTVNLTYDALGRMVEQNRSGSYTEIVYGPTGGKLALMNGQSPQKAFVPLPAGATAVYTSTGLAYYRHADWLGSSRLASAPTRTKYFDVAYAPYGESYAGSGTTDLDFTGQNQDTVSGMYDFLYREYHPTQGRWISPDPAGLGVVDPANPQSWNRYAYVQNNPLSLVDPLGLGVKGGPYPDQAPDPGNLSQWLWQLFVSGVPFVSYDTQWVPGSSQMFETLDENGSPVLDADGNPTYTMMTTIGGWQLTGVTLANPVTTSVDLAWWRTFAGTLFSWQNTKQAQRGAWNKGYYKCLGKRSAGGATAPLVTHTAGVVAAQSAEHGASTLAGAYYHFTDARFTAWGKYSQVLVPNLAPKIATAAKVLDVAGWAYFDYELANAISECSEVLQ
jgi:RHS repeat-associated protein